MIIESLAKQIACILCDSDLDRIKACFEYSKHGDVTFNVMKYCKKLMPQYPAPLRTETKVTGTKMQVRILSGAPFYI